MIKNILLLFNIVVLLLFNFLVGEDVKVAQHFPAEVKAGEEFTVDVTITKGNISGFAKLQQKLPEGLTATAEDTKGASFTFQDQKVKLIWMALPSDEVFTITYKVVADEGVSLDDRIGGKFSYLEENERKTYDIPFSPIKVLSETDQEEIAEAEKEVPAEAEASRTINKISEDQYEVTITIKKSGIEGFGKVQETLPMGMRAVEGEAENAVFSFVEPRAKFVWMSIPEPEELSLTYKVNLEDAAPEDIENITGEFSFLDQDETKKVAISTTEVTEDEMAEEATEEEDMTADEEAKEATETTEEDEDEMAEEVKDEDTTTDDDAMATTEEEASDQNMEETTEDDDAVASEETPKPEEEETTEKETEEETAQEDEMADTQEATDETQKQEEETTEEQLTSTPAPQTGINYRVQIAAGHDPVKQGHFKKVYKFDEAEIFTENHEGWIKYTIESFDIYKSARDRRNDVTESYTFDGPFVTAYNEGKRITVQEALMITNQKWFP